MTTDNLGRPPSLDDRLSRILSTAVDPTEGASRPGKLSGPAEAAVYLCEQVGEAALDQLLNVVAPQALDVSSNDWPKRYSRHLRIIDEGTRWRRSLGKPPIDTELRDPLGLSQVLKHDSPGRFTYMFLAQMALLEPLTRCEWRSLRPAVAAAFAVAVEFEPAILRGKRRPTWARVRPEDQPYAAKQQRLTWSKRLKRARPLVERYLGTEDAQLRVRTLRSFLELATSPLRKHPGAT
jgi:hypothetical protein